jgi:hypothetical protein
MALSINRILVPQGKEYEAVYQGLKKINSQQELLAIPIGVNAVTKYLATQNIQSSANSQQGDWIGRENLSIGSRQPRVLVMGLCGSLSSKYQIGDVVLWQDCVFFSKSSQIEQPILNFDREFTNFLYQQLEKKVSLVTGVTSDRFIYKSTEKLQLAQDYQASVVDMEGYAILQMLQKQGIAVAMLRVISDDTDYDLRDLNRAISGNGTLSTLQLAIAMSSQPLSAIRLIKSSLKGLAVLQQVTTQLLGK